MINCEIIIQKTDTNRYHCLLAKSKPNQSLMGKEFSLIQKKQKENKKTRGNSHYAKRFGVASIRDNFLMNIYTLFRSKRYCSEIDNYYFAIHNVNLSIIPCVGSYLDARLISTFHGIVPTHYSSCNVILNQSSNTKLYLYASNQV